MGKECHLDRLGNRHGKIPTNSRTNDLEVTRGIWPAACDANHRTRKYSTVHPEDPKRKTGKANGYDEVVLDELTSGDTSTRRYFLYKA